MKGQAVLVTGATGFVGSHLVLELIERTNLHIFCLVRPSKAGADRLFSVLKETRSVIEAEITDIELTHRVTVVFGDITLVGMGITDQDRMLLKDYNIDAIWHSAASLRYEDHWKKQIFLQNIDGTRNCALVAREINARAFYYISTAYVAGKKAVGITEDAFDRKFDVNNRYEESKRNAEEEVLKLLDEGIDVHIFRPSIVIGSSKTFDGLSNSGYYGFLRAIEQFKIWVEGRMPEYFSTHPLKLPLDRFSALDLVPVDLVVHEAVSVSLESNRGARYTHLTNPFKIHVDRIIEVFQAIFSDIKIEATTDDEQMGTLDALFKKQLDFYIPYILSEKQFLRSREIDLERFPCDLSVDLLLQYSHKNIHRLKAEAKHNKKKSEQILSRMTQRKLKCRHGLDLTYYSIGSGPVIVLFNAYGISLDAWKWLIGKLSESHKIITWECRGLLEKMDLNGKIVDFFVAEHAKDLEEILNAEAVENCKLVTWCSGSKPGVLFASQNPNRISDMVLIAPDLTPIHARTDLITEWDEKLIELCSGVVANPAQAALYVKIMKSMLLSKKSYVAECKTEQDLVDVLGMVSKEHIEILLQPFLTEKSIVGYTKILNEYFQYDISEVIRSLKMPVRFIVGENDTIAAPEQAEYVASGVNNATVSRIPAAGHFMVLECADKVYKEFSDLL